MESSESSNKKAAIDCQTYMLIQIRDLHKRINKIYWLIAILVVLIGVIFLVLPSCGFADDYQIFDENSKRIGALREQPNGDYEIFDSNSRRIGHLRDGQIYDKSWKRKESLKGGSRHDLDKSRSKNFMRHNNH